ncbi:Gag-like protein [Elysia marginata]|uniref:Gag-like protein n=1 Tax=Elysia marginata TaxID=1093978 RepID=A0AAV4FTR6_9GAST|nr:Gag-like protein [Elysia marginata]
MDNSNKSQDVKRSRTAGGTKRGIENISSVLPSYKRYMLIESVWAKPINDLYPIKIYKDLRNQVKRDLKISKCKKGLLVEVESENEVKMVMQVKEMCGKNVRVSKDEYLNRSKGVTSDRDLRGCDEEELVEDVPGVIHARRMEVRRGGEKIRTNVSILPLHQQKLR